MSDQTSTLRSDLTDEECLLMAICSTNTKVMAKTFFPERFYAEFSPAVHDPIFDLIDSDDQHVAIAAPRGSGKTSILALAKAAQAILFGRRKFVVYVSHSFENASLQTENLKRELMTNKVVQHYFGKIKATKAQMDGMDESFSKSAWVASTGTFVFPRGSGQQIRGLLFKNYRPDLIIIDDLEDPEHIESDDFRKKQKNWLNADLLKSTSRFDPDFKVVYIDTLKHHDALLESLISDTGGKWKSCRLEICDDNLVPTAPSMMSAEEVRKEYEYHKAQGILDVFYREFRNLPVSTEDAVFKPEYFKSYEERDIEDKYIINLIIVDPAKTVKLHSADSAIVVIGLDLKNSAIYFRDCVAEKMYPDQLYDHIFTLAERWNVKSVGIEVTSLNLFITQPVRNQMVMKGARWDLIELNAIGKKEDRVAALAPYYRQGLIYHNATCSLKLETQLEQFPRPAGWDVMDAFAYIIEMMDRGHYYLGDDTDDDEDYKALEEDYAKMEAEDDEPLEDWRYAI